MCPKGAKTPEKHPKLTVTKPVTNQRNSMTDMMEVQAELEARMASLGVDRFRREALDARQTGEATRQRSMSTVLDVVIDPTASAILAFRAAASSGQAGRRHTSVRHLQGLEAEALAFITAKLTLDGFARDQSLTRLAVRIGNTVELEQRLARFITANAAYYRTVKADLDSRTNHAEHRRKVFMSLLAKQGDDWDPWSDRDRLLVGTKLIELLCQATGLFTVETVTRARRRTTSLETTQRFRDWVASVDMQFEVMSPEFMPCVVPPKDWDALVGGGYHTDAFAFPLALVKARLKVHRKLLAEADLSRVYSAVNAIQRTPWRINTAVLSVVQILMDSGSALAGLPAMQDELIPSKPLDIDTNVEAKTAWKAQAVRVHTANHSMTSRRLLALKARGIAESYANYPAIYFPHQLDFRGRVYAVPQVLCPQGSDLAKGLLQFAIGKPITTNEQLDWLFIQGANTYGVDKVDFAERKAWVQEHQRQIMSCAANPLDDLWWTDADKPFCFLAWCFEYTEWVRDPQVALHGGPAMDGSCNGLQHYSAMLQDPIGGKAVNLVPMDTPQDIYAEVAKVVMAGLYHTANQEHRQDLGYATAEQREDIMRDCDLANSWGAFGVDRKITKRPVMVLPYGGTQSSCQKYVLEATVAKIGAGTPNPFGENLRPPANWLGARVWSGIGEVVVAARLAMGWLQDVTRIVSVEGLPLKWTTPSGFVVVQAYPEMTTQRIDTVILGSRFQPSLTSGVQNSIDRRRQANGVAPNFVHSLDAAALMLTVNEASASGVRSFATIHDSYGTHYADAPTLAKALRNQFVLMYEAGDTLDKFRDDVVPEHLLATIPSIPFVGGLDLSAIRQSQYFFA